MSPIVAAVLRSAVLPSVVATILLYVTGGAKRLGQDPLRARIQAWILALAYVFGSYMLLARIQFPPSDASESLSYVALLMALFVVVAPKEVSPRYALRAILVAVVGAILLWPIHHSLNNPVHWRNMFAFYCLCLGLWSIVERNARVVALPALIALPLISATGVSLLLMIGGSAALSQLVSVLCALLGAGLAISVIAPKRLSVVALLPFLSVFVTLFMVVGHFYLEINPWHMIYACWPFALIWLRPWLPMPKNAIAESVILTVIGAAPVGYFLFNVFKAAGPLY